MKFWRLIALIVFAVPSQASAEDVRWDGWFAGFDAGYIGRTANSPTEGLVHYEGPTIGLTGGRWWQMDKIALGFDAGLGFAGANASNFFPTFPGMPFGWHVASAEMLTTSARLKVGTQIQSALVYFAAGPQYVHTLTRSQFTGFAGPGNVGTSWTTIAGYTLSVGMELGVTPNIALKGEAGINTFFPRNGVTYSGWSGKFGINYYF